MIVDLAQKKSVIVSFLNGKTLPVEIDGYYKNITPKHCFEVGKALAQLHFATEDFSMIRPNELGIGGFGALFLKFENLVESYQKGLRGEILQNLDFLRASWRVDLPKGAAHLDLFPEHGHRYVLI